MGYSRPLLNLRVLLQTAGRFFLYPYSFVLHKVYFIGEAMLHWPSTPTSGEANTERFASVAKDDRIAHMLGIWSKSIRLDVCHLYGLIHFLLTSYIPRQLRCSISSKLLHCVLMLRPPRHEAKFCPFNRDFIFSQQSMTWKKRHCYREWQSRKGGQSSSNRVGEIARRNYTDAVLAGCPSLRREDCPCRTFASFPTHTSFNLTKFFILP